MNTSESTEFVEVMEAISKFYKQKRINIFLSQQLNERN